MKRIGRLLCLFLILLLVPLPVRAEQTEQAIVRDLIAYYFHWRDQAAAEIENQLNTLSSLDPEKGEQWRELMTSWAWINEEMPVYSDILPDGLPEDDSLCIVVLGFGLEADGSMKPELISRMEVALESAEKYPESYVLCTGGETAREPGISEAGQMGNWLLAKGLPHNRLILEDASLSTTANAKNSMELLWRDYPQVKSIVIVSSDYHIRWGTACFSAMNILHGGENRVEILGNAGCTTDSPDRDSMYSQAWGISILADVEFDGGYVPTLYMTQQLPRTAETEDLPVPAEESVPAAAPKEPVIPVLLGMAAVLVVLFAPKKRKKSDSD